MIFNDEKNNLNGLDGFRKYWYDLKDKRKSFFSGHSGGWSILYEAELACSEKQN